MTDISSSTPVNSNYAIEIANGSYEWYKVHAIRSRKAYRLSEASIVAASAAIPTSAAIYPHDIVIPAILGAVVVIISGLRALFHWHDNYLRFSRAREAVEAERRLYHTASVPYNDISTRAQILVSSISRIEQQEMAGWIKI